MKHKEIIKEVVDLYASWVHRKNVGYSDVRIESPDRSLAIFCGAAVTEEGRNGLGVDFMLFGEDATLRAWVEATHHVGDDFVLVEFFGESPLIRYDPEGLYSDADMGDPTHSEKWLFAPQFTVPLPLPTYLLDCVKKAFEKAY